MPRMYHRLFPFRRWLATSFLLVFVNVFVGQCWCVTLSPGPAASPRAHHAVAASPTHPGCHGHGAAAASHQKRRLPAGKDTTGHDCCKDKSASLLSSLTSPAQKQLLVPAPAVLPAASEFFFRPRAGQWDRTRAVMLVPRRHLPPKIPDIRIFLRSLTV